MKNESLGKTVMAVKEVFERNRFVEAHSGSAGFKSKLHLQIIVAFAFFILSIANIVAKSYLMLILTAAGCLTNAVSAMLARKHENGMLCVISSVVTCSVLFCFFVIYGGNDGFACLWVILLPFLAMVIMDFTVGLIASIFFQVFLIAVFWTPIHDMIFYSYSAQFCLRFPLFFFVTLLLSLSLTISLKKSQYNEYRHLLELEEMTAAAHRLARTDPLTGMANRRCAYEEFDAKYTDAGLPHCIVMGDIDRFKAVNDTYGHEFGDEVLTGLSRIINEQLPSEYLKSRWGGEEFLFAANEPADAVYKRIESLREAISRHEFSADGVPVHITVTFGIAQYTGKDDIQNAINKADNRLYAGKKAQRNCTVSDG